MNITSAIHRHLIRIGAILPATASALVAWVTMVPVSGIDLTVPAGSGFRTVGPVDIAVAAIVSGLAAAAVAALIERRARRPRRTWTILATGVFVVSLLGPLTSGAPAGIVGSLVALHSVVAVVLIPQIRWTLRRGQTPPRMETAPA